MPEAERQQLTQLRAQAQSRRLLDSLLKQAASGQRDMSTMLSRLDELATGLTAYQRGEVYYLLSRQFQAQGAHDLAAQMLAKLLEDEQHPLNPAAARDVLRSTSSVELKLRTQTPLSTGNDESKVTIGELSYYYTGKPRCYLGNAYPQGLLAADLTTTFDVSAMSVTDPAN